MKLRRWIGYGSNILFGLLFPYVLAGTVIQLHGFMAPSDPADKLAGAAIAIAYLGALVTLNGLLVRSGERSAMRRTLIRFAAVWIAACLLSVYLAGRGVWPFP